MQSYYIIEYDYSSVINHFLRVSTLSTDAWYMEVYLDISDYKYIIVCYRYESVIKASSILLILDDDNHQCFGWWLLTCQAGWCFGGGFFSHPVKCQPALRTLRELPVAYTGRVGCHFVEVTPCLMPLFFNGG